MVTKEIINGTLLISLNRPEKRNALHPELVAQLKSLLLENENSEDTRTVVLTGNGSAFCAGADLEYLEKLSGNTIAENEDDSRSLAELFRLIYNYQKPVIAAVNGPAIAGGCGLASVCDLIIAHPENSVFGYSEVRIGFIPAIVSVFLLRRIGEGHTKHMLLTGENIKGRRAYEIGFANYLSENVLDEAMKISASMNKYPRSSISSTKKLIRSISEVSVDSAIELCINLNVISRTSADFKDGIKRFLNKE